MNRDEYYDNHLVLPPECDVLCPFRHCYHKSEDKGSFQPGRGYINYHVAFRPVCATRHAQGCPDWRGEAGDKVQLLRALDAGVALMENNRSSRTKQGAAARQRGKDIIKAIGELLKKKL